MRSRLGFVEIGCIGVEPQVHLNGSVPTFCVCMCCSVVEEMVDAEGDVFLVLVEREDTMELMDVCIVLSMVCA
jgi:hypothetical protein